MEYFIGIDPGANGAAVLLDNQSEIVDVIKFKDATEKDIADALKEWSSYGNVCAVLEKVSAMPRQGVASTFKFGRAFGLIEGILYSCNIVFSYRRPQEWQKEMKCLSKGNKNVTKAAAQRLYPERKITHSDADAILIARYCYNIENQTI
jgi:Holliday junction resolvasome RuvABC endonuclease subunit